jgi:outer membrane protein OmpA-like peptidoglycan-associated protein
VLLTALSVHAAAPSAAQSGPPGDPLEQGEPRPSAQDLAASVRLLEPEVRLLEPQVRALQTEQASEGRIEVSTSSDVLFAFGSAELTPPATAIVQELAERAAGAPPGEVLVVGHTDGIGSDADNQVLSEQRAAAVADILRARLGPDRPLVTEGRGETEPVAPETVGGEDDPAGRALNRRVTVSFPEPG